MNADERRILQENGKESIPIIPCPVCESAQTQFFSRGYDRLFGRAPGYFILCRCASCGCIFQNPLPDSSMLPSFYPQEYWWQEGSNPGSNIARLTSRLERLYRELVGRGHVRFLDRCARNGRAGERMLLDIGCGNGTLLHLARRRGFVPHGMDISAGAVAAAAKQYGITIRQGSIGSDIWQGLRFDFITMHHTLEHLVDPRSALRYAAGLLKPGGSLILQVPSLDSLQARVFGARWYGLDVPRHVINFTRKSLQLLLRQTGYEICSWARFSLRDNPASLASSLVPELDPIGMQGRGNAGGVAMRGLREVAYLGLVLLVLPVALFESALGRGGTLWIQAKRTSGDSG